MNYSILLPLSLHIWRPDNDHSVRTVWGGGGGRGENSALASQNFIHLPQSYIRCCNVSSVNGNLFHTASIVCNAIGDKFGSKPNLKSPQLHQNAIQ